MTCLSRINFTMRLNNEMYNAMSIHGSTETGEERYPTGVDSGPRD